MNRSIILYGAGSNAQRVLGEGALPDNCTPVCFADRDIAKHGKPVCGLPVMSLQSALIEYPDSSIFVTLGETNKRRFFYELQRNNRGLISKVIDFRAVVPKRFCPFRDYFFLTAFDFKFCCENFGKHDVPQVKYDCASEASIIENFNRFLALREKMKEQLLPGCEGCAYVMDGFEYSDKTHEAARAFEHVCFDGHGTCNCRCVYCDWPSKRKSSELRNVIKVFELIQERYSVAEPSVTEFNYFLGEITVDKTRKEFYALCKDFYTLFATNGIVYDDFIEKQLADGGGCVYVSLDAGTRATYLAVKQVDAFDRVVANLVKYSSEKCKTVRLKYIFLPGINDNSNDIDGFIEICKRVNLLSADLSYETYKATYEEYDNPATVNAVRYMLRRIREEAIPFFVQQGILKRLCDTYNL
jgi:pyruvate-formate lyase-activating enzyme